ncbi:hypothetical protein [uncultured Kordia sp.]|uniref:hypothetical protein n=1 Tax=uncultured Kordia sp. TaxID=507699 RepID=UPI00260E0767|nr:hypothetical protein [uncultured Kordia sp.]
MGIALHVIGYKKNQDYITGEIKVLGWYEVNLAIDNTNDRIDRSETDLRLEIDIFNKAIEDYSVFGLYSTSDAAFIHCIADNMSGSGYRMENGVNHVVMFDAKRILNVIRQILHNIGEIRLDPEIMKMHKENLSYFENSLDIIAAEDGMVWLCVA